MSDKKSKVLTKAIILVAIAALCWFVYTQTNIKCLFSKCETKKADSTEIAVDTVKVLPVDTNKIVLGEIDSLNKR